MGNADNKGANFSKMALIAVCRFINLELDKVSIVAVVVVGIEIGQ